MGSKSDIRRGILEEATKLVTADRNSSYGEPEDNFEAIGALWDAWDAVCPEGKYSRAHNVAIKMVLFKIGRMATGVPGHRDNYVDGAGYLSTAFELVSRGLIVREIGRIELPVE